MSFNLTEAEQFIIIIIISFHGTSLKQILKFYWKFFNTFCQIRYPQFHLCKVTLTFLQSTFKHQVSRE